MYFGMLNLLGEGYGCTGNTMARLTSRHVEYPIPKYFGVTGIERSTCLHSYPIFCQPLVDGLALEIAIDPMNCNVTRPAAMAESWRCKSAKRLHAKCATCIVLTCPGSNCFSLLYLNPVTGKQVRARYVATREEIAKGNAEWEIAGPPEVRDVDLDARYFTPFRVTPHARCACSKSRRRSIRI